jgi:hypothetical protein
MSVSADDNPLSALGYAFDHKRRLAVHPDGDDQHSDTSNQRLVEFNTAQSHPVFSEPRTLYLGDGDNHFEVMPASHKPRGGGGVIVGLPEPPSAEDRVLQRIEQTCNNAEMIVARRELVDQVERDFAEMQAPDYLNRVFDKLNVLDKQAVDEFHHKLVSMHAGFCYVLAFAEADASSRGINTPRLRTMINVIAQLEYQLFNRVQMQQMLDPALQLETRALVLQFDAYQYSQLLTESRTTQIETHTLEALVFQALQAGEHLLLFDSGDGRDGLDYRICSGNFQIYVMQRAEFNGQRTHFYGKQWTLTNFIHQRATKTIVGRKLSTPMVDMFVRRYLMAPDLLCVFAKRAIYDRNCMAWPNGVYILSQDVFLTNDEPLPQDQEFIRVPRIVHPLDFTYIPPSHTPIVEDDFYDDSRRPEILDAIPTPELDRIFTTQQFPTSVIMTLLALLGRVLYDLHSLEEKHQILFYIHGLAGTGKSTLCHLIQAILMSLRSKTQGDRCVIDPDLTEMCAQELESNVEENFPLQNTVGKLAITISEVQPTINIPKALMLKMCAREPISIAQKNHKPTEEMWTKPVIQAGNPPYPYKDIQGEIERRLVVAEFNNKPEARDPHLMDRIRAELPAIVLKCNRVYQAWSRFTCDRDLYSTPTKRGALPVYFERTRDRMMAQLSKPVGFFMTYLDEGKMVVQPGNRAYTCPFATLLQHYQTYLLTQHSPATNANANNADNNNSSSGASGSSNNKRQFNNNNQAGAQGTGAQRGAAGDLRSVLSRRGVREEGKMLIGLRLVESPADAATSASAPLFAASTTRTPVSFVATTVPAYVPDK